jgi:uncharacterized membrane protein YphA (DoxX/SURF4 family)
MLDLVDLVGRLLFALLFLSNGWAHVSQREAMVGVGTAIGAPRPRSACRSAASSCSSAGF